jgi:hypothetical protein
MLAPLEERIEIESRNLNRPQVIDEESVVIILSSIVSDDCFTPKAPFQQPLVFAIVPLVDGDTPAAEVLHFRPMPLLNLLVNDPNFIDELVAALLLNKRLGRVRFIRTHKSALKRFLDSLKTRFDFIRVVSRTISSEKKFQDECRYIGALFYTLHQILPHDTSGKHFVQFFTQRSHGAQILNGETRLRV